MLTMANAYCMPPDMMLVSPTRQWESDMDGVGENCLWPTRRGAEMVNANATILKKTIMDCQWMEAHRLSIAGIRCNRAIK